MRVQRSHRRTLSTRSDGALRSAKRVLLLLQETHTQEGASLETRSSREQVRCHTHALISHFALHVCAEVVRKSDYLSSSE